jgi:serine/threonine protein kinase
MSGKVFKTNQESEQVILEVCPACKKPKTAESRKGSFTSYIFAANRCQCAFPQQSSNSEQHISDSSETESLNKAAEENTGKPDLGNRYEVLKLLGEGGMGSVWQVRDRQINKTLAIKVLRPELAADRIAVKRFEQEVQAASFLTQVNLVAVYGSGKTSTDCPFLIMDYLEGKNLAELLQEEVILPVEKTLEITSQICEALIHAHAKGIVHRDLKPSNIIITSDNVVKIVDFGIAKVMPSVKEQTQDLTQTGELFGSPLYMSPEQCCGESIDSRSDIYSLGCIIYEMLAGKPAFAAENPIKTILKQITEKPKPLSKELIPANIHIILERCLEKDPNERYWSCQELAQDINAVLEGGQPLKRAERTKVQLLCPDNASRRFLAMAIDSIISGFFACAVSMVALGITWLLNMPNWPDHMAKSLDVLHGMYWTIPLGFFIIGVVEGAFLLCVPLLIWGLLSLGDLTQYIGNQLDFSRALFSSLLLNLCFFFPLLFNWLYHACSESSKSGATIGKKLMNLTVSDARSQRLSFLRASLRHFGKLFTPWVSLITLTIAPFSKTLKWSDILYKRPFHDVLAKAYLGENREKQTWVQSPLITAIASANLMIVFFSLCAFFGLAFSGYKAIPDLPSREIIIRLLFFYTLIAITTYIAKKKPWQK